MSALRGILRTRRIVKDAVHPARVIKRAGWRALGRIAYHRPGSRP